MACISPTVFYSECHFYFLFYFFNSTSLLLPTHLPPPSCTHAQSYNPMDFSPPDSSVHGFFQARILEWVAISFSMNVIFKSAFCVDLKCVLLFILSSFRVIILIIHLRGLRCLNSFNSLSPPKHSVFQVKYAQTIQPS